MDFVYIIDVIVITFGIPFLIAMTVFTFKQYLSTRREYFEMRIDFEEYKKLSDKKKDDILNKINEIKNNSK